MYFRPPFAAGFTLTELLIAIAIIGILVTVVFSQVGKARDGALEARALVEFNQFENALEKYRLDTSTFPPDANRTLPPELDSYLDRSRWNKGPWANSIYDWDSWTIGGQLVQQLSIRFCPEGAATEDCSFPTAEWAEDFAVGSAVFYCFTGPCRSLETEDREYPGYCVNCDCQEMAVCHSSD